MIYSKYKTTLCLLFCHTNPQQKLYIFIMKVFFFLHNNMTFLT